MSDNNKMVREEQEQSFNDKLDVLKHVSDIKLRLRKDITNDFVLAKLGDKDKHAIVEMTGNAYFSKKLLDILAEKSYHWEWDKEKGKYKKKKISTDDVKAIKALAKSIFDSYMVKIYMTVILNRNVDKNYLINVLSGYTEKEEVGVTQDEMNEVKGAVSELLADQTKKEK